jgi:hypothetical protein
LNDPFIRLTEQNYFSTEANRSYMSASQLKSFLDCPARTIAELNGLYRREETTALLVGSYVDAHFSGTLDQFRATHPEIYNSRTGELKAEYRQAEEIIAYISADPLLMAMSDGKLQEIITGEIAGVPFRGKLDVLLSAEQCERIADQWPEMANHLLMAPGAIVDWKVMRDMEPVYVPGAGRQSFVEAWHYDLSMAIYQRLVQQRTGQVYPCFLLIATKEKPPDKALISIPQYMMDAAVESVAELIPQFQAMKERPETAPKCGKCDWCKQSKVITGAVDADELEGARM